MTTPSPSAFDPQAFEGAAEYYAVGRPPYSAQLADTMTQELSLDSTGQLLDVGCGPGVLELPLARLFDQVTALDPEPGMLQAGQRRCQQAGVSNVRWVQGVAEDIPKLDPHPWRAVTFGQSFHRVRQLEIAETVYDHLLPGGSLVLISHNADDGRPRPPSPVLPGDSPSFDTGTHPRLPRRRHPALPRNLEPGAACTLCGHPVAEQVQRLAHHLRTWAPRPDRRHKYRCG